MWFEPLTAVPRPSYSRMPVHISQLNRETSSEFDRDRFYDCPAREPRFSVFIMRAPAQMKRIFEKRLFSHTRLVFNISKGFYERRKTRDSAQDVFHIESVGFSRWYFVWYIYSLLIKITLFVKSEQNKKTVQLE